MNKIKWNMNGIVIEKDCFYARGGEICSVCGAIVGHGCGHDINDSEED